MTAPKTPPAKLPEMERTMGAQGVDDLELVDRLSAVFCRKLWALTRTDLTVAEGRKAMRAALKTIKPAPVLRERPHEPVRESWWPGDQGWL